MDDEMLALEVRKYVRAFEPQLYEELREEYQRWLASNIGTFLDFLLYLAATHDRLNPEQ